MSLGDLYYTWYVAWYHANYNVVNNNHHNKITIAALLHVNHITIFGLSLVQVEPDQLSLVRVAKQLVTSQVVHIASYNYYVCVLHSFQQQ